MSNNRIAKWDNLKFFLIVLVVMGHTIYTFYDYSDLAKTIYLFIYSFHMPAFIFVAGLFSKSAVDNRRYEIVVQFLGIYIIMKFLASVATFIADGYWQFHFLWESGPGWFALAMAVYILITMFIKDFDKRYVLLLALLIGCASGLDTHFGDHFASMRICVFFPVFLAGYYIDPNMFIASNEESPLNRVHILIRKIIAAGVLAITLALCMTAGSAVMTPAIRLFKGKYEYGEFRFGDLAIFGSDELTGIIMRLLCYALWAVLIVAVVTLAPEANTLFTWFGQRTMAIFIWHNFLIILIMKAANVGPMLFANLSHTYVIAGLCIAAILAMICAYFPEFRIKRR